MIELLYILVRKSNLKYYRYQDLSFEVKLSIILWKLVLKSQINERKDLNGFQKVWFSGSKDSKLPYLDTKVRDNLSFFIV